MNSLLALAMLGHLLHMPGMIQQVIEHMKQEAERDRRIGVEIDRWLLWVILQAHIRHLLDDTWDQLPPELPTSRLMSEVVCDFWNAQRRSEGSSP